MPAELDNMDPAMDQEMDSEMDQEMGAEGPEMGMSDQEGAMAKQELIKLANYASNLQEHIADDEQLEAWVQSKITIAATNIASVYHYLAYEKKIGEYGDRLDAEPMSESKRRAIRGWLMEAKSKVKELKKAHAEKVKEKKIEEGALNGGEQECVECGGTGMVNVPGRSVPEATKEKVRKYNTMVKATKAAHKRIDANHNGIPDDEEMEEGFDEKSKEGDSFKTKTGVATKTSTGVKHTNTSYKDEGDEIASNAKSGKGVKSHAKAQSAAEKKEKAPAQKFSPKSAKTYGMKDGEKFDNRDGAPAKPKKEKEVDLDEAKKKGDGNLANNAKPYNKVTRGDVIAGRLGKDEKGGKVKETAVSGAPQKSGIPATATTTVPGMKATGADLKKAGASAALGEAGKQTMSRAAKGHEKYGKAGMAALAKAGKEGKSLEPVKAKYNKYDESVDSSDEKKCPPMSHVKKMCKDGMSVAEICKMHPDCNQKELKQMVADCKKKLSETAAAADMWKNIKETTAYIEEKKNLPGKQEKIDVAEPKGKIDGKDMAALRAKKETVKESSEVSRLRELTGRLNQNEKQSLVESGDVASIRALTQKLLG